jgi:hypothetical protein
MLHGNWDAGYKLDAARDADGTVAFEVGVTGVNPCSFYGMRNWDCSKFHNRIWRS